MTETRALQKKKKAYLFGLVAEWMAAGLLLLKGYRPVAWRQRTPVGEVDLIARRGGRLLFVEVKARRTRQEAAEAILPRQRARLVRAAEHFLQQHPEYAHLSPRFDAMLVSPFAFPEHITNAWEAE